MGEVLKTQRRLPWTGSSGPAKQLRKIQALRAWTHTRQYRNGRTPLLWHRQPKVLCSALERVGRGALQRAPDPSPGRPTASGKVAGPRLFLPPPPLNPPMPRSGPVHRPAKKRSRPKRPAPYERNPVPSHPRSDRARAHLASRQGGKSSRLQYARVPAPLGRRQ